MTWNDLIRKHFPNASDDLCEFILWEKTEFPLVSPERIEEQIRAYKRRLDMKKQKIDKKKIYGVVFTHHLDSKDQCVQFVDGKDFYKLRNSMLDLGYEVDSCLKAEPLEPKKSKS